MFTNICFKQFNDRKVSVDAVLELTSVINRIPYMNQIVSLNVPSAIFIYSFTSANCVFNNISKAFLYKMR